MLLLAARIGVGDPGPGLGVNPGPIVIWTVAIVGIGCIVAGIVNRKKLEEIDREEKSKKAPKPHGAPWKCPKCGEMLESQFGACWKCGALRKLESELPKK